MFKQFLIKSKPALHIVYLSLYDNDQLLCLFQEDSQALRPLWRVRWPLTILCSNSLWLLFLPLRIPSSLTLPIFPLCYRKVKTLIS